jgi:hypothetical protein
MASGGKMNMRKEVWPGPGEQRLSPVKSIFLGKSLVVSLVSVTVAISNDPQLSTESIAL